jgi:hypothetical protein
LEFRNKVFNISLAKQNSSHFEKYTCIPRSFGNVTELAIVYERKLIHTTSGHGKYFIQFKRVEYGNTSNENGFFYPEQYLKDITDVDMGEYKLQSSSCKQEIVIHEFKRILFICQSITHNQYFVLSICSDSTCNEQTESLKIKDYVKEASFENINVKEMPGIDERTFSLIIWFDGLQYLEYLLIDEVGKMESQVFKLDFSFKKIRYFSGQFLTFESVETSTESKYKFMFFDFGVKRLDFNKAKPTPMLNFGNFVNSYVNPINGEIIVELLDKHMLLDMSLRRQTGEFMIEYSKRLFKQNETEFNSSFVFIFEVGGDYQLVIENSMITNSRSRGSIFKGFKIVNRFESIDPGKTQDLDQNMTIWKKVSGYGKLMGCSIDVVNKLNKTTTDFVLKIKDIQLVEPYAKLQIPNISLQAQKQEQTKNETDNKNEKEFSNDWILSFNLSLKITDYGNDSKVFEKLNYKIIKRTGFKIGYKQCIQENKTIKVESSGTTSDEIYPLKNIIRGNFLALKIACYSKNTSNCTDTKNKINPLLSYKTIMSTLNLEEKVIGELGTSTLLLALASNHDYRSVFEILGYNQNTQNLSIFQSKERVIIRRKSEIQKMNFNYSEVFNDTIFIIHSELGLFMYDSTSGNVKELIFDSGKCERILLMRHTGLDLVLWCFFGTSASAFYARDVVEGKAGIRKISVIIEKELNFSGKTLKFNDYFPEFIFMMGSNNFIEVLKIETDSAVRINRIAGVHLEEGLVNSRMCDFDMIDRHLMIYHLQRIGYGDRIMLSFYFIEIPGKFVRTKLIPVDYKFSPKMTDLNIYRYEDKKKYGMARTKYSNNPMFIISVLYLNKYANMLFIDVKAPIAESIPFPLLPLTSDVTEMKIGKSLTTNENHIRYSIVVFYEFEQTYKLDEDPTKEGKRKRVSLMKIDENDPALRLTDSLDKNFFYMNNNKTTQAYSYFVFEKDLISESGEDIDITVERNLLEGRSHRLELASQVKFFQNDSLSLDMKSISKDNKIDIPDTIHSQLFWLLNPTSITEGDVEKWSLRMESLLEQTSNGIIFNSLIRNKSVLSEQESSAYFEFRSTTKLCTQTRRDFLKLKINETNPIGVVVDFTLCISMFELQFFAKVHHPAVPSTLNFTKINNLLTANPENLQIYTNDGILELINYRKLNGRIVFSDFYLIELQASSSDPSSQKFELKSITRRFFAETTKDYLIRKKDPNEKSQNNATYEYYEWSILKGSGRFYILGLVKEEWKITWSTSNSTTFTTQNAKDLKLTINEKLVGGNYKIEIYDEFSFKVIDRNDRKYLWLLLENSVFETYIIRYEISSLLDNDIQKVSAGNNTIPYLWKLSNPYYGFESTYEIRAVKSDWLLVHFKIMNEVSYMMIYIVPPEVFVDENNKGSLKTLFVKEAIRFRNVKDVYIEKRLDLIGREGLTQNKTCRKKTAPLGSTSDWCTRTGPSPALSSILGSNSALTTSTSRALTSTFPSMAS